jgi:hypothetical protein
MLTPFDRGMLLSAAAIILLLAILYPVYSLRLELIRLTGPMLGLVMLASTAGVCRWAGFRGLEESAKVVFWAAFFRNLLELPIYVAARQQFPLTDQALVKADAALGFDVVAIVHWMGAHPFVDEFLKQAYGLFIPFAILGILLPALTGQIGVARRYVVAAIVATFLTAVTFAVAPAIGPWVGLGFAPYEVQATFQTVFETLRRPGPFVVDLDYRIGLITFPSFHVVLTVIAAWALARVKHLRLGAILVTILIWISTMSTGWHYAVDGFAGGMIGFVSLWIASAMIPDKFAPAMTHADAQNRLIAAQCATNFRVRSPDSCGNTARYLNCTKPAKFCAIVAKGCVSILVCFNCGTA